MTTRTITRTRRLTMDVEDCCVCGVLFAVERSYLDERRIDLATFYCPNGHGMTYTEDEIDLLRAQLTAKSDQLAAANRRVASLKDKMRRKHVRVGNGVCPCCNRSFTNLARHMSGQHPDYREARI